METINKKMQELGLNVKKPSPIEKILNFPYKNLEALSLEKVDQILWILEQYQIYVQAEYNRIMAKKSILKSRCDREMGRAVKNISGNGALAVKKAQALESLPELKRLFDEYEKVDALSKLLADIPKRIQDMVIHFRKIRETKEQKVLTGEQS